MGEEDSAASAAASVDLGPPEEAINPKNFKGRVFTDEELDEYVEREFGVAKAEADRRFEELKEWAAANRKDVGPLDDRYLAMFLRGSKYNMEKTKRKLVLFYHYRREYPCYYKDFSYDDPKIKRVLDKGAFLPLPAYDALGRRILFERVTTRMPVGLIDDHCKLIPWVFFQLMYYDKQAQILGVTVVSVTSGATWGHLYGYIGHVKAALTCLRNAFPGRLSMMHFLKPPMVVKPIITMTAALTGDKVGKMVYHDDYKDLLKAPNMVPESFPKEFGGTEFTEAEALLVWKAQCTPYMTNKYRT